MPVSNICCLSATKPCHRDTSLLPCSQTKISYSIACHVRDDCTVANATATLARNIHSTKKTASRSHSASYDSLLQQLRAASTYLRSVSQQALIVKLTKLARITMLNPGAKRHCKVLPKAYLKPVVPINDHTVGLEGSDTTVQNLLNHGLVALSLL